MHNEIERILKTVTFGDKTVPSAHILYTGKSPLYIVYSILSEDPAVCADDVAETSVVEIDVDIYAKILSNLTGTINSVKAKFIAAGWTWVEDGPEIFDDDTGYIHITITFEKERTIS